jgi:hypothetical protein
MNSENQNFISHILNEYYNKHIYLFIIKSTQYNSLIFINNFKFYKDLFIDNIKTSIIQHLQIMKLIFNKKIDKPMVKSLTILFCNKLQQKVKNTINNQKFTSINYDIISSFFIREIDFCLSREFSFYHYIK